MSLLVNNVMTYCEQLKRETDEIPLTREQRDRINLWIRAILDEVNKKEGHS